MNNLFREQTREVPTLMIPNYTSYNLGLVLRHLALDPKYANIILITLFTSKALRCVREQLVFIMQQRRDKAYPHGYRMPLMLPERCVVAGPEVATQMVWMTTPTFGDDTNVVSSGQFSWRQSF